MGRGFKNSGFTIVEVLVSITLIAILFGLFNMAQKNFSRKSQIRQTFHLFKSLNRRLYTVSQIRSQTYRLAIKIDPKGPEQVSVEKKISSTGAAPSAALAGAGADSEQKLAGKFVPDASFLKPGKTVTPLLSLTLAEGALWPEGQTKGRIYIYYHPRGPGDETALHFKREDLGSEWTLYFPPFQRELRIFQGKIPLEELKAGGS